MLSAFISQQFNGIGLFGVALVLIAYFLLQINQLSQASITFSSLNFFGSIFILISLYFTWNLASGVIEIAWLFISLYGLIMAVYRRYSALSS